MIKKTFLIVFFFAIFVPSLSFAGTIQLPQTGQTDCWDATGKVIVCAGTGQDGDIKAGAAWPNPRFTNNGDQTITDNLTGLIWAKDANIMNTRDPGFDVDSISGDGAVTWQHALDYVKKLNQENYLGHNDWHLPNVNEIESIVNAGHYNSSIWLNSLGFTNTQPDGYWSSSTPASTTSYAWVVYLWDGHQNDGDKDGGYYYVWPLRTSHSSSAIVSLPATGQIQCYGGTFGNTIITCSGTGQEGDINTGIAWPTPRFTDNLDETISDNLTGLIWTRDGNTPGPISCAPGTEKTWQNALDYVKCLNNNVYLGYNDWRLPNRRELRSLVNHGQNNQSDWLNSQGFMNVQLYDYWSSSSNANSTTYGWYVSTLEGGVYKDLKSYMMKNLWPVRSGSTVTAPTVTGRVITDVTGKITGIGNVTVLLLGTAYSTTTDGIGNFTFTNLPAGNYTLVVSSPSFIPTSQQLNYIGGNVQVTVPPLKTYMPGDANVDGKVGIQDAIYILQQASGLR